MRTLIYVDGFNLYFGLLKGTPHKWLDIAEFVRHHIRASHQIVGLKYFTATVTARPQDPQAPVRQGVYLRALRSLPDTQVILGHFLSKQRALPLAVPPPSGCGSTIRSLPISL